MDWVLGLHKVTRNGKTFNTVLTVTDRASRMVRFIPICKIDSAEDTADVMFWNIFLPSWTLLSIISDRDPRLTSEWWHLRCSKPGVHCMASTAYHPQTNSLADRTNQSMEQLLRGAHFNGDNWYDAPPSRKWPSTMPLSITPPTPRTISTTRSLLL